MISFARLPFHPRPLKRNELANSEVQLFHSPRCGRVIQIVGGTLTLTYFMLLEFDCLVDAYVERPCQIRMGDRMFDLSLWIKLTDGTQRYVLLVTDSALVAPGWYSRRDAEVLREAACRVGIKLYFVLESRVMAQCGPAQLCLRMLPLVQAARRLPNLRALREQIRTAVQLAPHRHLSHVIREFDDLEPGYVRAVICDLVHHGVLRVDGECAANAIACLDGGACHD